MTIFINVLVIPNGSDKCKDLFSSFNMKDSDFDGIGDSCDNCIYKKNRLQVS